MKEQLIAFAVCHNTCFRRTFRSLIFLKVIPQLIQNDFIAKSDIFLKQMDGYSTDLSGYIIVLGLRHVTVLVTLTPFSRS